MKKLLIVAALAALAAAFFGLGLDQYLSIAELKASLVTFEAWRATSPVLVAATFFAVYVLITALSLPGAAVATVAGGALFGLVTGTILVSFASSVGATLAFLASRHLLRESVEKRFGARLKSINAGIEHDGAFYLFTLRLVPLFPFFMINLIMGLTKIGAVTFYWVSQLGMLAGTLVYVNAGTQLAQIDSLKGILSPGLLLSFAILGLFPLLAKWGIGWNKARQVYAKWQRPGSYERNLVVIGAGAAGLVSAYIGAAVKARVTLVEGHKMGGDCLNYGCVPSKALIKSARVAHQMRHAARFGLAAVDPAFSFRDVMARIGRVIADVAPHDSVERYTKLGVEVLQGHARIIDPWTVEVTTTDDGVEKRRRLTTRSIVIATGAAPFVPPLPGLDAVGYLTSDTLWESFAKLDAPPKRLVVLGGGPIGCELAQAMARLGSTVSQVEMGPLLMAKEDREISDLVRAALERDGVSVLTAHKAVRCELDGDDRVLVLEHKDFEHRLVFDALLVAVGRAARLTGFGLEELGIETGKTVATNDYLETLYPNIYAAGDVAGPYQFTHTAAHQAWYAAVNALFGTFKKFRADYSVIPWATFVDPEVARVGLSEAEATEQKVVYEVTRYGIDDLDRAIADGAAFGFVKILTVPGKDTILGAIIVGEHAADLLAEFVLAMKHGLGLNKILGTIHTYPTMSEANKYAAGEWKRNHAPARLLAIAERYHTWRRG